jgi:hypothetical protein
MTTSTKTLTGTYKSGYTLQDGLSNLTIAAGGFVEGNGIYTSYKESRAGAVGIVNYGRVFGNRETKGGYSGDPHYYETGAVGIYVRSQQSVRVTNGSASDTTALIIGQGQGVYLSGVGLTVSNFGTIAADYGPETQQTRFRGDTAVVLQDAGIITNGSAADTSALIIAGYRGVRISGPGTVVNFGTITPTIRFGQISYEKSMGVLLTNGGRVTNGSASDQRALIRSNDGVYVSGGAGTVTNYGTVTGENAFGIGVDLTAGGTVTNGTAQDFKALISGVSTGVQGAGVVTNLGVITATAPNLGVGVRNATAITNGSGQDSKAVIEGYKGVSSAQSVLVNNFGAILGTGGDGVELDGGGQVINNAAGDISGYIGVVAGPRASVFNQGVIQGVGDYGVQLDGGGALLNGPTAFIQGQGGVVSLGALTAYNLGIIRATSGYGVRMDGGGILYNDYSGLIQDAAGSPTKAAVISTGGTIHNYGAIHGYGGYGVELLHGGRLTNGTASDHTATILGYQGARLLNGVVAQNDGVIHALAAHAVYLGQLSSLTNGSATDKVAAITGQTGVILAAGSTFTNFGTVSGTTAVSLDDDNCLLVVEAGCVFNGAVNGNRGMMDLANGAGVLTLLANANTVVTGSMATTTFTNFGTVVVGPSAQFTITGSGTVSSFNHLNINGSLNVARKLTLTAASPSVPGDLILTGTLSGAGMLAIGGGKAIFQPGSHLTIAQVAMSGSGAFVDFETGGALTYVGVWTQTSGNLRVQAGSSVNFTGMGDSFAGTLTGAITFGGGSQTLTKTTLADGSITIAGGAATTAASALIIGNSADISVSVGKLIIASTGVSLEGGTLVLGAKGQIVGATAASTLTNVNTELLCEGGELGSGQLKLVNDSGGAIVADTGTVVQVIDTGANSIVNVGKIQSFSSGGMVINSVVNNSGAIIADGGNLTVNGAVVGHGTAQVGAATLKFGSSFTQNVLFGSENIFVALSGVLELAQSTTYRGVISNFSKTGTTSLDLDDIAFGAKTRATYAGTTTSGVLTITDGTHTAKISFSGDYTGTTFGVSSDSHGGTSVVDNPTPAKPTALPFISAMAGFGANAAGGSVTPSPAQGQAQSLLTSPPV